MLNWQAGRSHWGSFRGGLTQGRAGAKAQEGGARRPEERQELSCEGSRVPAGDTAWGSDRALLVWLWSLDVPPRATGSTDGGQAGEGSDLTKAVTGFC